jgi:flagellar protein FliJ
VMPKSRRLDPLLLRACSREQSVARELASKTRELASHETQLADLMRYSDEYAVSAGGFTSPALLANRERFRGKLKEAITLQQRAVEKTRLGTEFERSRLMLAARETKVLENLAETWRGEERRSELRSEQRSLDEHAARQYRRAGDGDPNS